MISAKNVTKKFEDFTALKDVSCNIEDGCIYGMVGSNGAGKSTFLRIIAGVYKPDKGEAMIDGKTIYDNPEIKNNIVFVADELFFLTNASMNKMAKFFASIYDNFSFEVFNKYTEVFGLDPKKSINSFSKGMKRQAAIILAISTGAKYLFFDETFDGLDPVMRNLVKKIINDLVIDNGSTIIITSHSLRELEDICDHLTLLHMGGLVLDSDVLDLKTTKFKVQIAFTEEFDSTKISEALGEEARIVRYRQLGSVANVIINGDRDRCVDALQRLMPSIMDVLPLTLEEVFTYEMEALGYSFENVDMGVEDDE